MNLTGSHGLLLISRRFRTEARRFSVSIDLSENPARRAAGGSCEILSSADGGPFCFRGTGMSPGLPASALPELLAQE